MKRGLKGKKVARVLSSKFINKQILNSKRSFELAINTLVIIALALLVLLALSLAFTGSFKKFWQTIKGYSGSEIDSLSKICQSQCVQGNKYSFCCEKKILGKEEITCLDERLDVDCEINCEGVC